MRSRQMAPQNMRLTPSGVDIVGCRRLFVLHGSILSGYHSGKRRLVFLSLKTDCECRERRVEKLRGCCDHRTAIDPSREKRPEWNIRHKALLCAHSQQRLKLLDRFVLVATRCFGRRLPVSPRYQLLAVPHQQKTRRRQLFNPGIDRARVRHVT